MGCRYDLGGGLGGVSLCSPNEDLEGGTKDEIRIFDRLFNLMVRSPNRVLTPLKSDSKILISSFVPPSKIFVLEG
jgi:hypothetical protein